MIYVANIKFQAQENFSCLVNDKVLLNHSYVPLQNKSVSMSGSCMRIKKHMKK